MRFSTHFLFLLTIFLYACRDKTATNATNKSSDSTLISNQRNQQKYFFGDSNYDVYIKPLGCKEKHPKDINARLILDYKGKTLFSEQVFSEFPYLPFEEISWALRYEDYNGDRIKDLLLSHRKDKVRCGYFYLYLADTLNRTLIKVKDFEKIYNPTIENSYHVIVSVEYKPKKHYSFYRINAKNELEYLAHSFYSDGRDSMLYGMAFYHIIQDLKAK